MHIILHIPEHYYKQMENLQWNILNFKNNKTQKRGAMDRLFEEDSVMQGRAVVTCSAETFTVHRTLKGVQMDSNTPIHT